MVSVAAHTSARAAQASRGPGRRSIQVAAYGACGAGVGGIAGSLTFAGFYLFELQHPDHAPLGTANDLSSATLALLIPAALVLTRYLPGRRRARVVQAAGITALAVTAVTGPLLVAGVLGFNLATPLSAAGYLLIACWILAVSRMLPRTAEFGPAVTRFGLVLGLAIAAGMLIAAAGLALPWLSVPQLIVFAGAALLGLPAWLIMPAWYLFLGRSLAGAARAGH